MALFGHKAKKPGSVPGAASGGPEKDVLARARGVGRKVSRGRVERSVKAARTQRSQR